MTEPTPETLWRDLLEKDDRTSPEEYPDMALITFDEFCYCIDALTEQRVAAAVQEERERCAGIAGETQVEHPACVSRAWMQACGKIRDRIRGMADRPAPDADPCEQRVAAERERCEMIAHEYLYNHTNPERDIITRIRMSDRPAPEGAAPTKRRYPSAEVAKMRADFYENRCSTPSQEDTGSVSGEQIRRFAAAILHGDFNHRRWLMAAAEAYISGAPIPSPPTDADSECRGIRQKLRGTEAQLGAAMAALRPFAIAADDLDEKTRDNSEIWESPAAMRIEAKDLRNAKALLAAHSAATKPTEAQE